MSEKINETRKTVRTDELDALSSEEINAFLAKNPDVEIDIPEEWWKNAKWTFDKEDPSKVLCVSGPTDPEKVEK